MFYMVVYSHCLQSTNKSKWTTRFWTWEKRSIKVPWELPCNIVSRGNPQYWGLEPPCNVWWCIMFRRCAAWSGIYMRCVSTVKLGYIEVQGTWVNTSIYKKFDITEACLWMFISWVSQMSDNRVSLVIVLYMGNVPRREDKIYKFVAIY